MSTTRRAALAAWLLTVAAVSRAQPAREELERHRQSPFGIEYAFPHRPMLGHSPDSARRFAALGARWIKFQSVLWDEVEPAAPAGGRHAYQWDKLDRYVRAWQAAGYHVQMHLESYSRWASSPVEPALAELPAVKALLSRKASRVPRPERMADYEAWVEALVRRYDGDGRDDMAGLVAPILEYEIESEAQHVTYWMSSAADYGRQLAAAHRAARRASPRARIVLSGLHLGDLVADNPEEAALRERFDRMLSGAPAGTRALGERVKEFVPALLALSRHFDVVEFHHLEDSAETLPGTVAWIRRRLGPAAARTAIWAGDATTAPTLGPHIGVGPPPASGLSADKRAEARKALANPLHPDRRRVQEWLEATQARLAVQKAVVAAAAGCERIFLAGLEDWPGSPWPHGGLVAWTGAPRPVWHAYQRLVQAVEGFTRCERLPGLPADVRAYRFERPGVAVVVAWLETGKLRAWDEPPLAARRVRLSIPGGQAIEATLDATPAIVPAR